MNLGGKKTDLHHLNINNMICKVQVFYDGYKRGKTLKFMYINTIL